MAGTDILSSLKLDNSNFDANLKKSTDDATVSSRKIASESRAAANARILAEKLVGDEVTSQSRRMLAARIAEKAATQELAQIQSAGSRLYLDEATQSTAAAAALQRLVAAKLESAAASKIEAEASEHAVISQKMAASAVTRGLETGNVGIRAVENFITTIPGVGKALQTIFPLIGAAAFIGILVEMGSKLFEMEQKARTAGAATRAAFADLHDKAVLANDDVEITNSKLRDELAILEKRPTGIATSLLEAKKLADELLPSLKEDRKELEALLKEHDTSGLVSVIRSVAGLGNQASTTKQGQELLADRDKLTASARKINDEFDQAVAGTSDKGKIKGLADQRAQQIRDLFEPARKALQQESQRLIAEAQNSDRLITTRTGVRRTGPTIDNSQKIANVQGDEQMLGSLEQQQLGRATNFGLMAQVQGAKDNKRNVEVDKAADEKRLKHMEEQLNLEKLLYNVSIKDEFDYWAARRDAFDAGSTQYDSIVEKQKELSAQSSRQAHTRIAEQINRDKKLDGSSVEGSEIVARGSEFFTKQNSTNAADANAGYTDSNALAMVRARNSEEAQAARIQEQLGISLTKVAEAAKLAQLHTDSYNQQLSILQSNERNAQRALEANPKDPGNQKRAEEASAGLDNLARGRAIQMTEDQVAIYGRTTSSVVGMNDAIGTFIKSTRDNAAIWNQITANAIQSINQQIVNGLSGQRTDFKGAGAGIFRNVAGATLDKAEGGILGGLGLGKPDGSGSNPFAVKIVQGIEGLTGGLLGKFFGGSNTQNILPSFLGGARGDASEGGMSFLTSLLPLIPGFSSGTDYAPGGPSWVGENGPELLNLPRGARVTPNAATMTGMRSAGGDIHFHPGAIDARGSTDTAQVEAAAMRAVMRAAPHIVMASQQAGLDTRRRTPSTAQR